MVVTGQVDDSKILVTSSSNGTQEASKYARLLQEAYKNGEYELSKVYSDSLLLISKLYGIDDMGVMALNSQAIYYKNNGNKEKAIALYHQALKSTDSLPNNQGPQAMILVNMGNIYTDIGSYEKSIKTMDKLLSITDTIYSFSRIKAAALIGQSTNYIQLKDYAKGLEYCELALALAKVMKDENITGAALNNLSDIYIARKDYKNALETTEKGLGLKEVQKATKNRGWLLLNNGIAHYHLSQQDDAFNSFKESLTLAQEKKLPLIEMYSYEYLAKIYEDKEDFEKSFQAQKEYSRIKSDTEGDEKNAAITDMRQDIKSSELSRDTANQELQATKKDIKKGLLYGGTIIAGFLSVLLFLIYKKRKTEQENIDLREKYKSLREIIENTNESTTISKNTKVATEEKSYANSSLTESDRQLHKQRILQMMRLEKPYLNPELRLAEIAQKLDLSAAHFSEILHYCFKENFYNFINFYRVAEAQELLKQPSYHDEKIIAVAFDSGFKSKTTFNRVFKNVTGLTPSDYRKMS